MRRKGKTVTPSRRLQAKGEMSILQTTTKTPMKKIHQSSYPDLMIKMLSGNKKIIFSRLQLYAWPLFVYGCYAPCFGHPNRVYLSNDKHLRTCLLSMTRYRPSMKKIALKRSTLPVPLYLLLLESGKNNV